MSLFKKVISYLIIFILFFQFININSWADVPKPFRVSVEEQKKVINKDSVEFEWDDIDGADEYHVNYYDKNGSQSVSRSVYSEEDNGLVENLQTGIVYDFNLEAYNDNNVELIGDNDNYKLKVITGIKNFKSYRIDEEVESNQTVIGTKPGLKISWDKPLIRSGNTFVPIQDSNIDYEINIRKSQYSIQDSAERFKIIYESGNYHLHRWNGNVFQQVTNEDNYNFQTDNGISFDWTKEADENDPNFDKDSALLPGTFYYMEIYPRFKEGSEYEDTNYVKTDLDSGFISTYMKVDLTRNNNNVLFTGYRVINQGTFAVLPNFLYEFWVGADESNLTRQYYEYEEDAGEYAQNFVEAFITNAAVFENYYKVTAKANELIDGNPIELSSQPLKVNMSEVDSEVSIVPLNLEILNVELDDENTPQVTVRWDKPGEYQEMIDSGDYKYHIYLNTSPNDVIDENGEYVTEELRSDDGEITDYAVKYREAINIDIAAYDEGLPLSERIKVIEAEDIEEDEIYTGEDRLELTFEGTDLFNEDEDNYPTSLFLNKVYYLKIYISQNGEAITYFSVPVAFVTPKVSQEVPYLPNNFEIVEVTNNTIELNWEPVELDDRNYFPIEDDPSIDYEISISNSLERDEDTGEFIDPIYTISSDEVSLDQLDVIEFFKRPITGEYYGVKIKGKNLNNSEKLLDENTTYYIILRTKISVDDENYEPKYSVFSNLLPATTIKENIEEPGEEEKLPTAPDDFTVAEDDEGISLVGSVGCTLTWKKDNVFDDVNYRIIRTLRPVDEVDEWDGDVNNIPNDFEALEIDREDIDNSYRDTTEDYLLKVENLFPNTLYFFNIQAYRVIEIEEGEETLESEWITIPVTTTLINVPTNLEIVQVDEDDPDYNYFDEYHNLKIEWDAIQLKDDEDSDLEKRFDIAIKKSDESGYTVLSSEDEDNIIRFTNDKTPQLQRTDREHYSAIITGLEANTKYDIKIRVIDPYGYPASQYTHKVTGRTAFSSDEYDDDYRDEYKDAIYDGKIKKYKEAWYWVYADDNSRKSIEYKIKVKGHKFKNYTDRNGNVVIDFKSIQKNQDDKKSEYEVYLPFDVIDYIIDNNKNIEIITVYGSFMLYDNCFNNTSNEAIEEMLEEQEDSSAIEDVYVKINIEDLKDDNSYDTGSNEKLLSGIISITSTVEAVKLSDEEFENNIEDLLYGEDGSGETEGLIYEKTDDINDVTDSFDEMDEEIDEIIEEIDEELAEYISDIITKSSYVKDSEDMETLPYNMTVTLNYDGSEGNGNISIYYIEDKNDNWEKISSDVNKYYKYVSANNKYFDGYKYAVIEKESQIYGISNSEYKDEILFMENNYSVSEVFSDIGYINPENDISIEETVLIFDKVAGVNTEEYKNNDISILSQKYGLSPIRTKNVSAKLNREEAAFIGARLYELLLGADIDNMSANKVVYINDERSISIDKLKSVQFCIDKKIINMNSGMFYPDDNVTVSELFSILKKVIDLAQ